MTTRQWHDNHYEKTNPETHPQHWRRFIDIDPFNPENRESTQLQELYSSTLPIERGHHRKGSNILINSSRERTQIARGPDWAEAAGRAARELRDEINRALK